MAQMSLSSEAVSPRAGLNVLLTCAGRRNYLIRHFRAAVGASGRVLAADASSDAPALHEADEGIVLPALTDPNYLDCLVEVCRDRGVDLLVPLNDHELPLLATHRHRLRAIGTTPLVSSPWVIDACFDKWLTFNTLRKHGIEAPFTVRTVLEARAGLERGELAFPLVVKPRWGSSSRGIDVVADESELALAHELAAIREQKALPRQVAATGAQPKALVLVQQFVRGPEYGLDVINDLAGRYVVTFVKRKLLMRSGETDRAVTVQNDDLQRVGQQVSELFQHVGNIDCDVLFDGQRYYVLEINPRFGGGYPFSQAAGADLPSALLAWLRGQQPDPSCFQLREGVTSAKYDRLVVVEGAHPTSRNCSGSPG